MNYRSARIFAFVVLLAATATHPAAADAELTAKNIEVFTYETITNRQQSEARPLGFSEIGKVDGHRFLHVQGIFDVPWSDDLSRLSVNTRDIQLVLPDGNEIQPMAGFQHLGRMTLTVPNISISRPRDYPDADADLYYQAVWLVPEEAETVTLRIGGDVPFEAELAVPAPVAEPSSADYAEFDVDRVRRYRSVGIEERGAWGSLPLAIMAPENHVLAALRVSINVTEPNNFDAEPRFYKHTHEFQLVDDTGNSFGLVGERFLRTIRNSRYTFADVGQTDEMVILWGVPETLETATLFFAGVPVAEVSLSDAPVLQND
jgi:hypothetical protein